MNLSMILARPGMRAWCTCTFKLVPGLVNPCMVRDGARRVRPTLSKAESEMEPGK